MKTITQLAIVTLFVCLSSVIAFSQARSIKSVPEDAVYHSKDDGFNISLPADMVQKKSMADAGKSGRGYLWEFSDAAVAVGVEIRDKAAKTDADVDAAIASYKATIPKGDKLLSETPAAIGEYRGKSFVVESDAMKILIIFLVYDKFNLTLVGSTESKSPDVQRAIAEAIQSFEFVH